MTSIDGIPWVRLVMPEMHRDARGFFCVIGDEGMTAGVRECMTRSRMGVIRGLHIRSGAGEAKLVRCSHGLIYDVVVDLRKGSPTYLQWEEHWLDGREQKSLFIPPGCAHGYQAVTDADVTYRISGNYDPEEDLAIAWNDPELAITWPVKSPRLSDRDRDAPTLAEARRRGLL